MSSLGPSKVCPTCGLCPVSTKSWKRVTLQDDLLGKQRHRIEELKERIKELENE